MIRIWNFILCVLWQVDPRPRPHRVAPRGATLLHANGLLSKLWEAHEIVMYALRLQRFAMLVMFLAQIIAWWP